VPFIGRERTSVERVAIPGISSLVRLTCIEDEDNYQSDQQFEWGEMARMIRAFLARCRMIMLLMKMQTIDVVVLSTPVGMMDLGRLNWQTDQVAAFKAFRYFYLLWHTFVFGWSSYHVIIK
jgi:hypothetical protein